MAPADGAEFSATNNEWVYLLGFFVPFSQSAINFDYSLAPPDSHQILGRIRSKDLVSLKLKETELRCNSDDNKSEKVWKFVYKLTADERRKLSPWKMFGPRVTEASLQFSQDMDSWFSVSLQPPDDTVILCKSSTRSIDSDWSCQPIYTVGAPWNDYTKYITYAAKLHREFLVRDPLYDNNKKSSNELIVSVVTNALNGFSDLYSEAAFRAYTPQFSYIRLKQ